MRAILIALALLVAAPAAFADQASDDADKQAIRAQAKAFSTALMAGDLRTLLDIYTPDAVIIPGGKRPMKGRLLNNYWVPREGQKTIYHYLAPTEITLMGDVARDYGIYEGERINPDGTHTKFSGVYGVMWQRIDGVWRMSMDTWHPVRD